MNEMTLGRSWIVQTSSQTTIKVAILYEAHKTKECSFLAVHDEALWKQQKEEVAV
jgi:hypothetical protein